MAQEAINARMPHLPPESRPLEQCVGQTLREDVYAERDNPPFDRVCMDGIAISSNALARGQRHYKIVGIQAAGSPATRLSSQECAIEVMTGAILPHGTDCVIPLEEYDLLDGAVALKEAVKFKPYDNVQRRGSDSEPGVAMLRAGTKLGAPEIAVVASAGLARVRVTRQPRLVVISTGDELIEPGQPIEEHQVRRSNAHAVVAALHAHGFTDISNDHIRDDEAVLRARLSQHLGSADALILSGGVSKGRFDLVPNALQALRVQEVFHEIAQRPGAPMWFGMGQEQQAVFGLPGNPVATLICLIRYVIPALTVAMGLPAPLPEPVALAERIKRPRPETSFVPISLQHHPSGKLLALPRIPSGSGDFLALAGTTGFIELPPQGEPYQDGFVANFYRW
jgi:molybdopterin molybdotransferase